MVATSDTKSIEEPSAVTAGGDDLPSTSEGPTPLPQTVIKSSLKPLLATQGTQSQPEGTSENGVRKMSGPNVNKELPPITPDRDNSDTEWGEMHDGFRGNKEYVAADEEAAIAKSTAVFSTGTATPPAGLLHPDAGMVPKQTASQSPPPLPPKDRVYLDTTPKTPLPSAPSSIAGTPPQSSSGIRGAASSPSQKSKDESSDDEDAQSELHTILDQFDPEHELHTVEESFSHHAVPASPETMSRTNSFNMIGGIHPPRTSSLEAIKALPSPPMVRTQSQTSPHALSRTSTHQSLGENSDRYESPRASNNKLSSTCENISSLPLQGDVNEPPQPLIANKPTLHKPPPPELDPDLPFDFHRFLEQLQHRTADPVAKYLRSFLSEFSKKQWMVHEQEKIVHDFLHFITRKMAQCEVWREVSDQEFDNAKEGMEKLVMNRLYSQTFSPAIPPPNPPTSLGARRSRAREAQMVGRRGQHQEDVERDEVLAQKVRIYGWIREEHLDLKPLGESGRKFLTLAKQELEKIKTYRAPRDKVICVLNCCKVIFGLIRHASDGDESADRFVPLLIYVVLRANPEHLVSNVQYILRFRNPDKLGGEAGYYLSSLMGAIQFIESLDRSSLTITDEEFERNVEVAVAAIAEKHTTPPPAQPDVQRSSRRPVRQSSDRAGESSSTMQLRSVSPRPIQEKPPLSQPPGNSNNSGNNSSNSTSSDDPAPAVSGILRTIQKPLSMIFGDATVPGTSGVETTGPSGHQSSTPVSRRATARMNAEEAAARQASAETAEALRIQRAEHENVVEILASMFPALDKDLISDVVVQQDRRVGLAVDALLSLSSG